MCLILYKTKRIFFLLFNIEEDRYLCRGHFHRSLWLMNYAWVTWISGKKFKHLLLHFILKPHLRMSHEVSFQYIMSKKICFLRENPFFFRSRKMSPKEKINSKHHIAIYNSTNFWRCSVSSWCSVLSFLSQNDGYKTKLNIITFKSIKR